jgi:allophanate hydrolase subunit 1
MSASANEIRLSPDGKTVMMPVETFRAREADLLRYEQMLPLLQRQNEEKQRKIEELIASVEKLMALYDQERMAADALHLSLRGDVAKARSTYGLLGFVVGGIAVGLTK